MEPILLFQYTLSLIVVAAAVFGLSRLKQALLRYSRKLQKGPPSA